MGIFTPRQPQSSIHSLLPEKFLFFSGHQVFLVPPTTMYHHVRGKGEKSSAKNAFVPADFIARRKLAEVGDEIFPFTPFQ